MALIDGAQVGLLLHALAKAHPPLHDLARDRDEGECQPLRAPSWEDR
jgi:hypothetical protein